MEKLQQEWNEIFVRADAVYIYGNGAICHAVLRLIKLYGDRNKVRGIIVSELDGTPAADESLPIMTPDDVQDKNAQIIVAVSVKFRDDIFELLSNKGFNHYVWAHKYLHLFDEGNKIDGERIEKINVLRKLPKNRETLKDILRIMYGESQQFGEAEFYQSLPSIDLEGVRDTRIRLQTYMLEDLIRNEEVLDIGSNCGFLDLTLASVAKHIDGVEYNESLVMVANEAKNYLEIENVSFFQGDFTRMCVERQYDTVFFFAVHEWIDMSPSDAVEKLCSFLRKEGTIVFESQNWDLGDERFELYCEEMKKRGFRPLREGFVSDDGKTHRKFVILQK